MAKKDVLDGAIAVVCGSGPSLKEPGVKGEIRRLQTINGAKIFACKAAISFLSSQGIKVDYGVSMDPGAHIADPRKIKKVVGVTHIIASTSDPALFDYLLGNEFGESAEVQVFHSACGFNRLITEAEYKDLEPDEQIYYLPTKKGDGYFTNEELMYRALFPDAAVMGGGFNVVNRAVSLAQYMGASKIVLAGADCGWRDDELMYVDGPAHRPGVDMNDKGLVDGKNWNTRPDMLASAVALVRAARQAGAKHFEIIGDTLPHSLMEKDDAFLDQVASF